MDLLLSQKISHQPDTPAPIQEVIHCLSEGGLVLFPTDTTWVIGCLPSATQTIERIYDLKQRPSDKPMILLADSVAMVKAHVQHMHPRVETLLNFHQRPLTVIYPQAKNLPAEACAPDGSVAFRITQDPFCQELIQQIGSPILTTSPRLEGMPLPSHFGAISSQILEQVDKVVKYRQTDRNMGEPSVIAYLNEREELEFLRN
jgi:L-threonylcarbamoyladenylate synthase